jgi:hypothetical protein
MCVGRKIQEYISEYEMSMFQSIFEHNFRSYEISECTWFSLMKWAMFCLK